MTRSRIWMEASRPKTLTAAAVPVGVGTSLAAALGLPWSPVAAILALVSATLIQIGTNLVNDAIDFARGTDDAGRVGPRRASQSGLLPHGTVLRGGLVCFACAAIVAVPLVIRGGLPILLLGLASIALGYLYTGGPFPLAYVGLGEVFVVAFFGIAAVGGTYWVHAGSLGAAPLLAGLQVGLLATALLAVNNLRDIEGDLRSGKRTLAARFGPGFGRVEIAALVLLPFALGAFWATLGRTGAATVPLLCLPLAIAVIIIVVRHAPGPVFNRALGLSALLHLLFGVLVSTGFFLP